MCAPDGTWRSGRRSSGCLGTSTSPSKAAPASPTKPAWRPPGARLWCRYGARAARAKVCSTFPRLRYSGPVVPPRSSGSCWATRMRRSTPWPRPWWPSSCAPSRGTAVRRAVHRPAALCHSGHPSVSLALCLPGLRKWWTREARRAPLWPPAWARRRARRRGGYPPRTTTATVAMCWACHGRRTRTRRWRTRTMTTRRVGRVPEATPVLPRGRGTQPVPTGEGGGEEEGANS
mmetsp:Transcript_156551/g.502487  ORF Transcript_156551/g.502487 Transcript_156551/m.502487 type:complete len:232 (+) Transcript_156551:794-1489(+)